MDSTKVEMEEAKEENRRLKSSLSRIKKEFEILQTQYNQLMVQVQHEEPNKFSSKGHHQDKDEDEDKEKVNEREELVLLSLGRRLKSPVPSGSVTIKEEKKKDVMEMREAGDDRNVDDNGESSNQGLSMGIEYKDLSNPNEKLEIDRNQETPSLGISSNNTIPSENSIGFKNDRDEHEDEEEILPQNLVKKTRVSVRSRCETPTVSTFSSHF